MGPGCFVGPGRCVCRWAAARPRDRHTRACGSEWSISRPALALPPPTGTAADPSGVLYTCGAGSLFGSSTRRLEARPGPATAHGNRSLARLFLWASWGSRVLSFSGARVRVVTNVVNPRCFSCGFLPRCYERRQSEGFFAEMPLKGPCWASFFAPIGPAPRSCRRRGARGLLRWGFCSIRSWLAACRRRVVPLMTPFPPFGDGPAEPSAASARSMCGSRDNWTLGQRLLYSSAHADYCFAPRRHEPARPGHGRPDALPYPDVPA